MSLGMTSECVQFSKTIEKVSVTSQSQISSALIHMSSLPWALNFEGFEGLKFMSL